MKIIFIFFSKLKWKVIFIFFSKLKWEYVRIMEVYEESV